jgi:hypothetical protein
MPISGEVLTKGEVPTSKSMPIVLRLSVLFFSSLRVLALHGAMESSACVQQCDAYGNVTCAYSNVKCVQPNLPSTLWWSNITFCCGVLSTKAALFHFQLLILASTQIKNFFFHTFSVAHPSQHTIIIVIVLCPFFHHMHCPQTLSSTICIALRQLYDMGTSLPWLPALFVLLLCH